MGRPRKKPDTVVISHDPAKPPDEKKVDERSVGYQFPDHHGLTPFDFAVNEKTGRVRPRKGDVNRDGQALWGVKKQDLSVGIADAVLPPLSIWKDGRWLNDVDEEDQPLSNVQVPGWKNAESNIWLTSGEGSPGAFVFYAFFIPPAEANAHTPRHPMLWGPKAKAAKSGPFNAAVLPRFSTTQDALQAWKESWEILEYGFLFASLPETEQAMRAAKNDDGKNEKKDEKSWRLTDYDRWGGWDKGTLPLTPPTPPQQQLTTTTVKAPPLPIGVRFRCQGCGHWYKEADFAIHGKNGLCPALDNGVADWTILCDDRCGCELIQGFPTGLHTLGEKTLDHVCVPKPGFPRPKQKEVNDMTETETPDEGTTTEEGTPDEGTTEGEGGEDASTEETPA